MLVIRDALLSQLQKDSLRRKIIMAEVDKIERAVALLSDTAKREQAKLVSSSGGEFIPDQMHEGSIELESRTPAMEDRFGGRSCSSDSKEGMENAAYDEQKLQGSNQVTTLHLCLLFIVICQLSLLCVQILLFNSSERY